MPAMVHYATTQASSPKRLPPAYDRYHHVMGSPPPTPVAAASPLRPPQKDTRAGIRLLSVKICKQVKRLLTKHRKSPSELTDLEMDDTSVFGVPIGSAAEFGSDAARPSKKKSKPSSEEKKAAKRRKAMYRMQAYAALFSMELAPRAGSPDSSGGCGYVGIMPPKCVEGILGRDR